MRIGWATATALLLLSGPLTAAGEIYRWTDADGRIHFTQQIDQVPAAHRARAREGARKQEPSRVTSYVTPASRRPASPRASHRGEIRVPFRRDGSLMRVEVTINDLISAPFYVDTGASGVSLPARLAEPLGIVIRHDTPRVRVVTANGVVARAVVRLDSVQLGAARVENLQATINPSMQIGLLGGDFFNNFVYRVDAAESELWLAPNEKIRAGLGAEQWRDRFRRVREPLERLEAYLADQYVLRSGERKRLELRRQELIERLDQLEKNANRLAVPQIWRR